jgi:cytochrome c oxidase subunit 2
VYEFPRDRIPDYAIPKLPYPESVPFDDSLVGDPARGLAAFNNPAQAQCIGCHNIVGNPMANNLAAPDLTHIGTRTTIAGAIFPATREYMARWLKNAPAMKPGSLMPPQGQGLVHVQTGARGNLTDQQIA